MENLKNEMEKLIKKLKLNNMKDYIIQLRKQCEIKYKTKFDNDEFTSYVDTNIDFILEELKPKIDWDLLSQNKNISYGFFEKHIDKINFSTLINNINIPLFFIEKHIERVNWDLMCSTSQLLTYEDNINEMNNILLKIL